MIKVLFICHGNICRSPMAQYVMQDIVNKAGASARYEIASAATSYEEIGNGVYPPARKKLAEHGIGCEGHSARHITPGDYKHFDLLIGMDDENARDLHRYYSGDPEKKIKNLPDYYGDIGGEISDPWYTRNFEQTWQDVLAGCTALFKLLEGNAHTLLDFSSCADRKEMFALMRREMNWEDWYGSNLDALYDILTGTRHKNGSYKIILPPRGTPAAHAAMQIYNVFREAEVNIVNQTDIEKETAMNEVYEFLKSCGTYYLATCENGKPHVRPFGTVDVFEGKLYFQTGLKKDIAKQLAANPNVEISGMTPDGRWIRLSAEAVLDDNVPAQEHMLDAFPSLRGMYTPGDGNTAVYYLKNATAQICSFTAPAQTYTF